MNSGSCFNIVGSKKPIPLQSIDVVVRIKGFVADVESTLCYKNTESGPIEAVYEFPMDDQSAVYRFEAKIEDRTIVAECQEKKEARDTYNEATRRGYTATLMEEHDSSSDIFRCLVGNLPPNTEARIIFAYVTELSLQPDGKLSFTLPTLLNPRYTPQGHALDTANVRNDPPLTSRPYVFNVKAYIMNTDKIVGVTSNKDDLDVQFNDTTKETSVTLVNPFVADHDLTFQVTYDEPQMPKVIVERGRPDADGILKQDVVMINFFPHIEESSYSNKKEFIFVIDRSGSMAGSRINEVKESLLFFLKSLPQGCYFNIVGFGSRFEVLFQDGSREYSEESLAEACNHQQKMIANLGGTEILAPLLHIYSKPCITTHGRQMFLLTDGEVTNTQDVIDIVKKNASHTRVFAFGIGQGSSTSLIKGVARAGRGIAEFVMSGEALQPRVMKILKAAMQSSVTDIHLEWQFDGAAPKFFQVPRQLPQIFAGDRFISYAVFTESLNQSGKVYLKGKIDEQILEYLLTFEVNNTGEQSERSSVEGIQSSGDSLAIHRLAAKSEIKHLQDDDATGNKAAIILLSTAANIISCHTSMVGVDKDRKEVVTGNMVREPSIGSRAMFPMPEMPRPKPPMMPQQMPSPMMVASRSSSVGFLSRSSSRYSCYEETEINPRPPIGSQPPASVPSCPPRRNPISDIKRTSVILGSRELNLNDYPWFDGTVDRVGSENLLGSFEDGTFMVRIRRKQDYVLSVMYSSVRHLLIKNENGKFILGTASESFDSLPELVEYYKQHQLTSAGFSKVCTNLVSSYKEALANQTNLQQNPNPHRMPTVDAGEPTRQTVFMNLVMFQTFCGSWKLTDQLAKELQLDLNMLKSSAPIKSEDAWATVLVLSFLRVKLPDKRDEWEVIARKAEQWLTGQDLDGHSLGELLEKAKNVLQ